MNPLNIIAATAIAIFLPFIGALGLRIFLHTLIGFCALILMVGAATTFADALTLILSPWLASSVALPVVILILSGLILGIGFKLALTVEGIIGGLTEGIDKVLGTACGITLAFLIDYFLVLR